jgi:hypothetical protein
MKITILFNIDSHFTIGYPLVFIKMFTQINEMCCYHYIHVSQFRRYLFFLPGKRQNGFIRLRSEGKDRVTLTCKIFTSASKYPKEDEIVLSSTFEQAYSFLLNCGLKEKSYIETRREKWRHPLAKEIVIDHWPGIIKQITTIEEAGTNKDHYDLVIHHTDGSFHRVEEKHSEKNLNVYDVPWYNVGLF